jgi:pyridoxal phosphate enzyme (YggS family)
MDVNKLHEILSLCEQGNPFNEKVTLVGAIKTIDADTVNLAIKEGLKVVAENKAQEFRDKAEKIIGAEHHFIGHLQSNKIKYVVGKVSLIHSVDSISLAEDIDAFAKKKGLTQNVLAEINIGGELSKSGFNPDNVKENVYAISKMANIKVVGLMAMMPKSDDQSFLASLCNKMRGVYDELKLEGLPFRYLSMGMSADYKVAIKNGSNMIRLGSSIFGKRNYEVDK